MMFLGRHIFGRRAWYTFPFTYHLTYYFMLLVGMPWNQMLDIVKEHCLIVRLLLCVLLLSTDIVVRWFWSVHSVNAVRDTQLHRCSCLRVGSHRLLVIPLQWHRSQCSRPCTKVHWLCRWSASLLLQ